MPKLYFSALPDPLWDIVTSLKKIERKAARYPSEAVYCQLYP